MLSLADSSLILLTMSDKEQASSWPLHLPEHLGASVGMIRFLQDIFLSSGAKESIREQLESIDYVYNKSFSNVPLLRIYKIQQTMSSAWKSRFATASLVSAL